MQITLNAVHLVVISIILAIVIYKIIDYTTYKVSCWLQARKDKQNQLIALEIANYNLTRENATLSHNHSTLAEERRVLLARNKQIVQMLKEDALSSKKTIELPNIHNKLTPNRTIQIQDWEIE